MKSRYHSGELEVQARAGVTETARRVGGVIRSTMPKAAQEFLTAQQFVILSTVGADGRVWASILTGKPGFMEAVDDSTLRISSQPISSDPIVENLKAGDAIGVLVIELATRRRMKVKGKAEVLPAGEIVVRTQRVYALCPKYIQAREVADDSGEGEAVKSIERREDLSDEQQLWIAESDTFFIASFHPETGADASHRGGAPGFVRVLNGTRLIFPDYSGNNMFNTLGNITVNPNAGLLFIDFEKGRRLQITGRARVVWDQDRLAGFAGAERLVEFEIGEVMETAGAIPLRWKFLEYSPFNPG